jgi:molybdate transport system substrate-binding protein
VLTRLLAATALTAFVCGQVSIHGQTGVLSIAAASDLRTVFPELVDGFERETGLKATVTFGSSGNFFAQIQNGAPFDVFFSADIDYPRLLATSGHADASTLYEYATGRIVLWTRKGSGIDVSRGLAVLGDARVRRIAIANPKVAPYGRAAEAALRTAGLYEAVQAKLVRGDNTGQTAQLVESGNADVAILPLSLALGDALSRSGVYLEIPASAHPPIEQAVVIMRASKNRAAAARLLAYLKGPQAQATFRKYGFTVSTPAPVAR